MGMMDNSPLVLEAKSHTNEIVSDGIIEIETLKHSFRYANSGKNFCQNRSSYRSRKRNSDWVEYVAPNNSSERFRILLIGNEHSGQSIRITLTSHLALDMDYFETRSGMLSFNTIESEEIDLIIFGEGVADMDGLEFLDQLNANFGKQKIPVIEILNSDAGQIGIQAMKLGAHDYLLKNPDGLHFELLPILVSRIYDEKQAMNALRQSSCFYQAVSECIPSVLYQLSLQGGRHDVRISPQIIDLGLSSDKWGNDTELHHQMCHVEDRPVVRKALEYSYTTGTNFKCEYRVNTISGKLLWFRDKAKIVKDRYGRPLFMQGVMTDITRFKLLESELIQYQGVLDKMVEQRTECLNRRVAILEYCNSNLGESNHKIRQKYIELLSKIENHGGMAG